MKYFFAALVTWILCAVSSHAQERQPSPQELEAFKKLMGTIGSLQFQSGEISLAGGKIKIHLPSDYQYLNPANARKVLVDIFGNPPVAGSTDGMIVPKGINFLAGGGWTAVLHWKEEGFVKDNDFAKIDFNEMLSQMTAAYKQGSDERVRQGYGKMELAAWAQEPHYDAATHKLYYAKLFDVEGPEQQLNYDIRVLGRHCHFEVSIMASRAQMPDIESQAPAILNMIEFTEGNRYADFKPGTDKVAAYGIAGLIAGGVFAKAGFFKLAGLFFLKFGKVILVGVAVLIAGLGKFLGKKKSA